MGFEYDPVPRSVTQLLDETVSLMRRRAGVVTMLCVLPLILVETLTTPLMQSADPEDSWLAQVLAFGPGFVAYVVLQGFPVYLLTWMLAEELSGRAPTRQDGGAVMLREAPRIAWTHLLWGVLYVAGFAAFVLPMFWVLLAYFVSIPVMCVEERFGWTALRRSQTLMKGAKRRVLVVLLLWFMLVGAAEATVGTVTDDGAMTTLLRSVATSLLAAYLNVFALLFYVDLRIRSESFDLELFARRVRAV